MGSTPLLRLLHFLLLLLPAPLHDYCFPRLSSGGLDVYHPLILFAGFGCPDLEARLTEAYTPSVPRCGALKGKGWFPIYKFNTLDLVEHDYVPCFQEQMALVYDPVHNKYRNLAGVETRVLNFGSAYGFSEKQMVPDRENLCLVSLRKELEAVGYRDGDTLFGAPYDMRYAPPSEGYVARVQKLVEHASSKNGDKPVILVGHSFGATAVLGFLTSTPLPWRNKFIKHLLLISPPPPTGFTLTITQLTSGPSVFQIATVPIMELRPLWRTFASALLTMPSPVAFGHKPLVITKHRNYSAYHMEDLLLALGFTADQTLPFLRRRTLEVEAPLVPTTYIIGGGIKTPEQLVFWEGDFDVPPENVYGEGDGTVNMASLLAFGKELRRQQERNNVHFKALAIANATHAGIVLEEHLLRMVMTEILQANR